MEPACVNPDSVPTDFPRARRLIQRLATACLLAAACLAVTTLSAVADDRHHRGSDDRHDGQDRGHRPYVPGGDGSNGLPTFVPGLGTFSGGIAAQRDRGNGIYFSIRRRSTPALLPTGPTPAGGAKVITVSPEQSRSGCDMENGVCVIRP